MKPKSWEECPSVILEDLLWDVELDYDSYESSKAEVIHEIICNANCVSRRNEFILNEFWDHFTESAFRHRLLNVKQQLEWQLENLNTYLS